MVIAGVPAVVLLKVLFWATVALALAVAEALEPALCDLCDCKSSDVLCQDVRLPSGVLAAPEQRVSAQSLSFSNCSLPLLTASDLAALPNVTELRAERTRLRLAPGALAPLRRLLLLSLESAGLEAPPDGACAACPRLRSLGLAGNGIAGLLRAPFALCARLRALDLSGNRLRLLGATAFSGLTALTELDLSRNQLTRLDPAVFAPMTSLSRLHLDGNRVASFGPGFVTELLVPRPTLVVSLEGNPLRCACGELRDAFLAAKGAGIDLSLVCSGSSRTWDSLADLRCPGTAYDTTSSSPADSETLDLHTLSTNRVLQIKATEEIITAGYDGYPSLHLESMRSTQLLSNSTETSNNSTRKNLDPRLKDVDAAKSNTSSEDKAHVSLISTERYQHRFRGLFRDLSRSYKGAASLHDPNSIQSSNRTLQNNHHDEEHSQIIQQSASHNNEAPRQDNANSNIKHSFVSDVDNKTNQRDTISRDPEDTRGFLPAPARLRRPPNEETPAVSLDKGPAFPKLTVLVVSLVSAVAILGCATAGLFLILLLRVLETRGNMTRRKGEKLLKNAWEVI